MAKEVRIIPATIDRYTSSPVDNPRNRRVAAYARVSTTLPEQVTSYEAQVDYYEKYIKNHTGWDFVDIYTDEGISGCNTKHRKGFNEMVRDALDGKIDLIITKSVSRFARNTVDTLSTIYKLREHNVECYFEKENIYSFDSKCDLMLTFMSGLAQQESRSISENTTWGHRKRFADGKVSFAYSRFLGYDMGENGELVINEEQAAVVRRIYGMYIQGHTFCSIARKLTEEGVATVTGKTLWRDNIVKSILTNEKYRGDAMLQKTYTVDFLSKKTRKNSGEIPKYYIKENHAPIIPPEIFDMVQRLIEERKNRKRRISGVSAFSGKVICGNCGGIFGTKVWHANDKYRRVVLQCNNKFKNEKKCNVPHLTETALKELAVKALNKILPQKQMKTDLELIKECLSEIRGGNAVDFPKDLYCCKAKLTDFDEELFNTLVDHITVYAKDDVRFTFINGMETRV